MISAQCVLLILVRHSKKSQVNIVQLNKQLCLKRCGIRFFLLLFISAVDLFIGGLLSIVKTPCVGPEFSLDSIPEMRLLLRTSFCTCEGRGH